MLFMFYKELILQQHKWIIYFEQYLIIEETIKNCPGNYTYNNLLANLMPDQTSCIPPHGIF